jgi:hypothetical protein
MTRKIKRCAACHSKNLVNAHLSIKNLDMTLKIGEYNVPINFALVCKDCGNVMPLVSERQLELYFNS